MADVNDASGAAAAAGAAGAEAERASSRFLRLARSAYGAANAVHAFSAAKSAADATGDLAQQTEALANGFGLSSTVAQQWAVAARANGVDASALSATFRGLSLTAGEASSGAKAQADAFRKLGVDQRALASSNLSQLLLQTAAGFDRLAPGAERNAAGVKLFGDQWAAIQPLLSGGSAALNDQLAAARRFVPELGRSGSSTRGLARHQRDLKLAMMGVQVAAGQLLLPVISKMAIALNAATRFLIEHRREIKAVATALAPLAAAYATIATYNKVVSLAQRAHTQVLRAAESASRAAGAASRLYTTAMNSQVVVTAKARVSAAATAVSTRLQAAATTALRVAQSAAAAAGRGLSAVGSRLAAVINQQRIAAVRARAATIARIATSKLATAAAATQRIRTAALTAATKAQAIATRALNVVMRMNPIGLVVTAIAGLVAILVVAYKKVGWFRSAVDAVFKFVRDNWKDIGLLLIAPIGFAVKKLIEHWREIGDGMRGALKGIGDFLGGIWIEIESIFVRGINWVIRKINFLIEKVNDFADKIPGVGKLVSELDLIQDPKRAAQNRQTSRRGADISAALHLTPGAAQGGVVRRGGSVLIGEQGPEILNLPSGASVQPLASAAATRSPLAAGAGTRELHVHVNVDRRELTRAVVRGVADLEAFA